MESLIRLDLKSYLVSILNRQDKMSMAASIESRVPFLDYRLVEWGARIPFRLKTDGLETKIIVKKLGERFLPRKVVYRRKSGFGVPVSEWLRDKNGMGKYLALFEEPRFRERGYLKTETVRGLAREHLSGKCDHGEILWELINLELWHRIFIENSL
jgi:asparagine synthase (glutamine-hydrolysing)